MEELVHVQLTFKNYELKDSGYHYQDCFWHAETLVEAAKDIPEFEIPLAGIDLGVMPWTIKNIHSVAEHFKRVMKSDLKYPVILDETGYICDGWHRVTKALLLGRTHIRGKRISIMPEPDERHEKKTK